MVSPGLLAIIVTFVAFSISLTLERRVATLAGTLRGSVLVLFFGLLPLLVFFSISNFNLSAFEIFLSLASGILFAVGYVLYYKSLETEQISNTTGVGLIQPALLLVFSIVVLKESITFHQTLGGIIIFVGVILIITNNKFELNRKLIPALVANISWAGYWIIASYAILSSQQVGAVLLISRFVGFVITTLLFAIYLRNDKIPQIKSNLVLPLLAVAIAAGLLDGLGNATFGFVIQYGVLSLGSIFVAGLPLSVTLLAYFVYKERLTKLQGLGMMVAVIGALVIAAF
ncbi:MAG: DMT family transporter [Candidatus Micrarchaeota archaeon]|nr:DMT family transporter [Candidatus Micrarchaeota archaeon]